MAKRKVETGYKVGGAWHDRGLRSPGRDEGDCGRPDSPGQLLFPQLQHRLCDATGPIGWQGQELTYYLHSDAHRCNSALAAFIAKMRPVTCIAL
jgi:hypothetical protein